MKKIIFIIATINIGLLLAQFFYTSHLSTSGLTLVQVAELTAQTQATNQKLKQQIYTHQALTQIDANANSHRLKPLQVEYIGQPAVASKP